MTNGDWRQPIAICPLTDSSDLKRVWPFIWKNLKSLHLRILLKLSFNQGCFVPSGSEEGDKNVKSLQTNGQTDTGNQKAHLSFQLRWVKNHWRYSNVCFSQSKLSACAWYHANLTTSFSRQHLHLSSLRNINLHFNSSLNSNSYFTINYDDNKCWIILC